MAKQYGVIQYTGKLGQTVGMKNGFKTSSGNFTRAYVEDPANPQTAGQMSQRIRMLPAVLFRRQIQDVIARAWEGTDYGGPSIRKFMRYALKEPIENIPQIDKDSVIPVPGKYLVSKGSLGVISVTKGTQGLLTNIPAPSATTTTIGNLSASLINGGMIQDGDQVTIVLALVSSPDNIDSLRYKVLSFVVDSGDAMTIAEWSNNMLTITTSTNVMQLHAGSAEPTFVGAAVVLSREGASPLRSTSRMFVDDDILAEYFGDTVNTNVTRSYGVGSTKSSVDWPYEGGGSVRQITIGIEPIPSNLNPAMSGAGTYDRGSTVTLRTANNVSSGGDSYYFVGWYTDAEHTQLASNNPEYTFVAQSSGILYAYYEFEDRP